jgi:hypothetical protein
LRRMVLEAVFSFCHNQKDSGVFERDHDGHE